MSIISEINMNQQFSDLSISVTKELTKKEKKD